MYHCARGQFVGKPTIDRLYYLPIGEVLIMSYFSPANKRPMAFEIIEKEGSKRLKKSVICINQCAKLLADTRSIMCDAKRGGRPEKDFSDKMVDSPLLPTTIERVSRHK